MPAPKYTGPSVTRLDGMSVARSYGSACHLCTCGSSLCWNRLAACSVASRQSAPAAVASVSLQGFSSAPLGLICMYDTLLWDFPCLRNNDVTLIGRMFLSRGSWEPQELWSPLEDSRCTVIRERNYRRSYMMDSVKWRDWLWNICFFIAASNKFCVKCFSFKI